MRVSNVMMVMIYVKNRYYIVDDRPQTEQRLCCCWLLLRRKNEETRERSNPDPEIQIHIKSSPPGIAPTQPSPAQPHQLISH